MAIDAVALELSTLPDPLTKENTLDVTATATTTLSAVNTNCTRVEFLLLRSILSTNPEQCMGEPIARSSVSSPSSTGVYEKTFAASLFQEPGTYQIQAAAIVGSGSPEVIGTMLVTVSDPFTVEDTDGADEFNVFTDYHKELLNNPVFPIWKKVTLTGEDIVRLLEDAGANMAGTSGSFTVATLPTGAVMVGGLIKVTSALSGAATITGTLGADSTAFTEVMGATDLKTAAETGVSASFVPNLAGGTDLKSKITVTTQTLADIADSGSVTYMFGYVVPEDFSL